MILFLWFSAGLALLLLGSEWLIRGGTRVAARLGVPPIVIGLTIVAIGTSTPELAVGIDAAIKQNGAIAVGNIAGTNTVNILLILGLGALLDPIPIRAQTIKFDLPCMIGTAIGMIALAWDGTLSRSDGALMLGAGVLYTIAIIRLGRRENASTQAEFSREFAADTPKRAARELISSLWALLGGLVLVIIGADWMVDGAVGLARKMGVSDALIGLTIVALGTSAPELVTTIVGTIKKERDIAVGNLLGSSVYNILAILGITCLVPSGGIKVDQELIHADIPIMIGVTLVCVPVFWSGRRVGRLEGAIFVISYCAYVAYLLIRHT